MTKKAPAIQWLIEQDFLYPFDPVALPALPPLLYAVRKDNTISYKSNLYSLPLGTYKGRGTQVTVCNQQGNLIIYSLNKKELCRHPLSQGSGLKIINTDHKRDKSDALREMARGLCELSEAPENMRKFISASRTDKPRYLRDQLIIIREALKDSDQQLIEKALTFCLDQEINSANDFRILLNKFKLQAEPEAIAICTLNPLNGAYPLGALVQPERSRIEDYHLLLNPQLN